MGSVEENNEKKNAANDHSNFGTYSSYHLAGHSVARIGYGTMQLRRLEKEPDKAIKVLKRAFDLGVNHIDTAQFYANGFINTMIRKSLPSGNKIVVATKVGADPNPGGNHPLKIAQRPEQLRATIESNLISLGLECIPLVNLRRLDVGPGVIPEGDQIVDMDDQLAELMSLREKGKIGAIGLSGVDLNGLRRALPASIACVQNAYSLVSRQYEDMLECCLANNIAWVPFFPLGGAGEGWPKVTDQQKVIDIAMEIKATPSQVGLAWLLKHASNVLIIPGTASIEHLKENIAVGSILINDASMSILNGIGTIG